MSNEKLSAKQEEILDFIKQEILTKGYPPSVREIGEAVNLKSTSSVHAHLESLEKKGYIRKDPTKPRTIEVVDDSFNLLRSEVSVCRLSERWLPVCLCLQKKILQDTSRLPQNLFIKVNFLYLRYRETA